jgi:hypothetical protein
MQRLDSEPRGSHTLPERSLPDATVEQLGVASAEFGTAGPLLQDVPEIATQRDKVLDRNVAGQAMQTETSEEPPPPLSRIDSIYRFPKAEVVRERAVD